MIQLFIFTCLIMVITYLKTTISHAHGYVQTPASRSLLAFGSGVANGLEAGKGFPNRGPLDGRIASANCSPGSNVCVLDQQTSTRWPRQLLNGGTQTITWRITASHASEGWQYWITRPGWNPNEPLARYMFEQIAYIPEVPLGAFPPATVSHQVPIPTDRQGYHVILAIWDNGPLGQGAFYQVIDVELNNPNAPYVPEGSLQPEFPVLTGNFPEWVARATYLRGNRVSWEGYVYEARNNHNAQSTPPSSDPVRWQIVGQLGGPGIPAATTPTNLHTVGETSHHVELRWNASSHATEYHIQRGESLQSMSIIASVPYNHFIDHTVSAGHTYLYRVLALNAAGQPSAPSDILTVTVGGSHAGGNGGGEPTIPTPEPETNTPIFDQKRLHLATALNGTSLLEPSGNQVVLWTPRNQDNQIWQFNLDHGSHSYTIQNVAEDRYLAEVNTGLTLEHHVTPQARWRVVPTLHDTYQILNVATGRSLDVEGGNHTANGTRVIMWSNTGNPNQRWYFQTAVTPEPEIPEIGQPVANLMPPLNLHVTGQTQTSISLAWQAPYSSHIDGYELFRDGIKLTDIPAHALAFTDHGLTPGTTYHYTLRSYAYSAESNTATGTTTQQVVQPPQPPQSNYPEWSATQSFLTGSRAIFNGNIYEARFNLFGAANSPGLRPDRWILIGPA